MTKLKASKLPTIDNCTRSQIDLALTQRADYLKRQTKIRLHKGTLKSIAKPGAKTTHQVSKISINKGISGKTSKDTSKVTSKFTTKNKSEKRVIMSSAKRKVEADVDYVEEEEPKLEMIDHAPQYAVVSSPEL